MSSDAEQPSPDLPTRSSDFLSVGNGPRTTDHGPRTTIRFTCMARDPSSSARTGLLETPHGSLETPAFMPVGTQATVKGITPEQLRETGSRMILANTYHLALRPGEEVVAAMGGLHRFMGWDGPILTDSGGFQVFSLAARSRISDEGVTFRSHIDGRLLELTPERAMAIQEALGSDIAMCLDQCPPLPADKSTIAEAVSRTIDWARRCKESHSRPDQALFGIVQGGSHADLRAECVDALHAMAFDGYAVGGVSVGEGRDEVRRALAATTHLLPIDRPRYLMGVGRPQDIIDAVATGIDLFDCVMPTRNGRNATCFTDTGCVKLAIPPIDATLVRSRRAAIASPAAHSVAPTCAISSWPRRCLVRSWHPSII